MIAYLIPGADPLHWQKDSRAARLIEAGPWQANPDPRGALVTWVTPGNLPLNLGSLAPGRICPDGLIYYAPLVMPSIQVLSKPLLSRYDLELVELRPDLQLRIIPAYASPRKLLSNGEEGDFTQAYAIRTRDLMERLNKGERGPDINRELHAVCMLTLRHSYRLTDELLDDLCWLDTDSRGPIWEAALGVGKEDGQ